MKKTLVSMIFLILAVNLYNQQKNDYGQDKEYTDLYVSFYHGIMPAESVNVFLINPYGEKKLVTSERLIDRMSYFDYSDFNYKIEKNAMSYIKIEFPERDVSIMHGLVYSKPVYLKVSITLKNKIRLLTSDSPIIRE